MIKNIKFYWRIFYSVLKKDGVSGVLDHGRYRFWIFLKKVFARKKFKPKKIVFLSECPGAAMRYRCDHVVEQLSEIGVVSSSYEINRVNFESCIMAHEVMVLHRVLFTPQRAILIRSAQKKGKVFIFDTDDLVFNLEKVDSIKKLPVVQFEFMKGEFERQQKMLMLCDYAIGSTLKMKEELELFLPGRCFVHENMISDFEFGLATNFSKKKLARKDFVIGYASGTRTHDDDFLVVEDVLLKILKKHPHVKFRIIGHLKLSKKFKSVESQLERKKLVSWKKLPELLSGFDINLAPLEELELNEAKSDLKFFEAACVSVPTVATDIGAFSVHIEDGKTGFLVKNEKEWFEKLEQLVLDRDLRQKIGGNAQESVRKKRNALEGAKSFQKILEAIGI